MLEFIRKSPFTGKLNSRVIDVTPEEFSNWFYKKALIQDAMPRASTEDREFLMTGLTPEDWETMFGEDSEEDSEEWDGFNSDAEADADVLRNAGMGTDEDYGYFDERY